MDNNNLSGNYESSFETTGYTPEEQPVKKGLEIASLVLGILSLLCCCVPVLGFILGIVGLVLGILGARRDNARGLAVAGIVMSVIGVLMGLYMLMSLIATMVYVDWSRVDFDNPEATIEYLEELERSLEWIH